MTALNISSRLQLYAVGPITATLRSTLSAELDTLPGILQASHLSNGPNALSLTA